MKTCEVPRPGTRIQRLLPPLPSKKSLCLARRERDRHGPWAHVASRRPTLAAGRHVVRVYGTKASKMSQKSVSRVCCSSAACARCRDAPLAGSVHSLGPRECTDPAVRPGSARRLRSCNKLETRFLGHFRRFWPIRRHLRSLRSHTPSPPTASAASSLLIPVGYTHSLGPRECVYPASNASRQRAQAAELQNQQ